ncbi:PREDICTED: uncharacterized protein LOC108661639 [Theobroma cacao]|uniref:Uncharacterized protein LOC108661639 n=1 Tax=Theobroma cacao TaxID=3641 RepID=A0AB32W547_THECC|nr:PREDICTED: uncharacterized protein LOC108661639 [Theobroma cacao]
MDTASEIWTALKQNFAQPDDTRICNLQYTIGNITQGSRPVDAYFIELKGVWEELRSFRPLPHCDCGNCNPNCFKKYFEQYKKDMVFKFLNGLNESFSTVRSQIILMDPIPALDKVYSLVLREEAQRNMHFQTQPTLETAAMYIAAERKKKVKRDIICNHCGKKGHVKEECYRLVGFLEDFKFTKGKNNVKKGKAAVNNVSSVADSSAGESQFDNEEESGGNSSMSQMSIIKQQVRRLMELLSENGLTDSNGKNFSSNTLQTNPSLINLAFAGHSFMDSD